VPTHAYADRALALIADPPPALANDRYGAAWPENLEFVLTMPLEEVVFAVVSDALGLVDHRARLAANALQAEDLVTELLGMRPRRGIPTKAGLIFTAATHESPWTFRGTASKGMQRVLRGNPLPRYAAGLLVATGLLVGGSATVSTITDRNLHVSISLPAGGGIAWDVTKPESATALPPRDPPRLRRKAVPKIDRPALLEEEGTELPVLRQRSRYDEVIMELYRQGVLNRDEFERAIERASRKHPG